jgi:hypothetical protein
VEAQQCVKLSLTNRPFGLISKFPRAAVNPCDAKQKINPRSDCTHIQTHDTKTVHGSLQTVFTPPKGEKTLVLRFDDPVVMAKAPTPDPIPNSVVKSFSANGTAS